MLGEPLNDKNKYLISPKVYEEIIRLNISQVRVQEIDPALMGGTDFCEHYHIELDAGANTLIVEASRGEEAQKSAILVPVSCKRIDFNGTVRRHLGARRVSFAVLDEVIAQTDMEYGSITVIGLPEDWRILIDPSLIDKDELVIGSGRQKAKLILPGKELLKLKQVELVEVLCKSL